MLKLVQIWSKATGPVPVSPSYSLAAPLLTEADLKDDEFDVNDPDIPEFLRERKKEHQREKEVDLDSERRQSAAEKKEHDKEEKDHRTREWLASEQYRRALQQLQDEIADARAVTERAYERALADEKKAGEALDDARRNALVVSGNRVYLTRDGSRLYGEDRKQITDRTTVEDATRQKRERPDATTYDDFVARMESRDQAAQTTEQLKNTLSRLNVLGNRVSSGSLSPEDLAQARNDEQNIIASLPSEARKEYEQRAVTRERPDAECRSAADLYTGTDSFQKAPDVSGHFDNAVADPAAQTQSPNSQPGSKPVSKNTDDYRQGF